MKDNIKVCTCEQCRGVKKKKNRKLVKRIKRQINKKRRTSKGEKYYTHYWA